MTTTPRPRRSLPVRLLLVAALVLIGTATLMALLVATDTALSVWERLQTLPAWLRTVVLALLGAIAMATAWGAWRLLRAPKPKPAVRPAVTRETVEQRVADLRQRTDTAPVDMELQGLDQRAASGEIHVALFGEISAGKTSLLRALSGRGDLAVDVRGGTTREIALVQGSLPDGRRLIVADVPGLNEADDDAHGALAREEATRSHAVVYVCDGDLTRAQDSELNRVLRFGKPAVLALNKIDRYRDDERRALLRTLRDRYGDRAAVVAVCAGGESEVLRRLPDGRDERVQRTRPAEIAGLLVALQTLTAPGARALEPTRQRAVLEALSERLERTETELRAADAERIVVRYTRRAVIGALAALAPGSDLVIQGILATALLRELAQLYGASVRDIDLDAFIDKAAGTVRTTTSIALAIAGNALKAFPGLGTISGGLLHAIAYGLIFDSLGRAVAQTLATRERFDVEDALQRFEHGLRHAGIDRAKTMATLALESMKRESDQG